MYVKIRIYSCSIDVVLTRLTPFSLLYKRLQKRLITIFNFSFYIAQIK